MSGLGEIALIRGLSYLSESQAAIAHTLANVTSVGYKRRIPIAKSIGQDFNEVLEGRYPTTRYSEFYDLSQGTPNPTGSSNHVALQGKQLLKVVAGNGSMFFTRNGQLQINSDRHLVTNGGHKILDDQGQPIVIQGVESTSAALGRMKINPNGQITIKPTNTDPEIRVGRMGVFEVPDPTQLAPAGNGLFSYPDIGRIRAVPTDTIVQGALEQSNVEPTTELINMILAQRGFSASMKALTTLGRIKETYITSLSR